MLGRLGIALAYNPPWGRARQRHRPASWGVSRRVAAATRPTGSNIKRTSSTHHAGKPTVNLNASVIAIALVVALTIAAAVFRVSTAPERIRMRLETAKATCIKAGGEWIKVNREELCQPGAAQKKI